MAVIDAALAKGRAEAAAAAAAANTRKAALAAQAAIVAAAEKAGLVTQRSTMGGVGSVRCIGEVIVAEVARLDDGLAANEREKAAAWGVRDNGAYGWVPVLIEPSALRRAIAQAAAAARADRRQTILRQHDFDRAAIAAIRRDRCPIRARVGQSALVQRILRREAAAWAAEERQTAIAADLARCRAAVAEGGRRLRRCTAATPEGQAVLDAARCEVPANCEAPANHNPVAQVAAARPFGHNPFAALNFTA
jgi:hypothetical protein